MPDVFTQQHTGEASKTKSQKTEVRHHEAHNNPHALEKPETDGRKTSPSPIPKHVSRTHKLGLFSTFVRDPLGIILAEQHEDEHILLFSRRAFVTNIPWIIFSFGLMILPFFFPFLLAPFQVHLETISPFTTIILLIFYYLIILGYVLINFTTWFYDIDIVTERRAVDIDFYNISFVSVATARVQDLKDVRFTQKGIFASLSDYGDVTLAVEASGELLVYEDIPHPAEVVSMLSVLIGGHRE